MSAIILNEATRAVLDDGTWRALMALGVGGGVADNDDQGRPILRYATATGKPVAVMQADAAEGEVVGNAGDDPVYARGRRWDVAEDVGWSRDQVNEFYHLRSGLVARSKASLSTGCKLDQVATLDDLRAKLRDPKEGGRWAKALSPANLDDAPGLFVTSELMLQLPEIARVERVMPYARQIFPMRFLNAPGAESYRFTILDEYGDARWTSNFDGTVPMVGQSREHVRRPLEYMWMGALWGLREMLQWQQARSNGARLPEFASERPRIAREALLRQENLWLWFGGPKGSKILGLFSPENAIPKATASAHWTTLNAGAFLTLVQTNVSAIRETHVEVPDTVLLPIAAYDYAATLQWPNTDKMLLQVMLDALKPLGIREIIAVPECSHSNDLEAKLVEKKYDAATAARYAGGVDGKDAMVILSRRESKLAGIVSQDIKLLPPEVRPTKTSVIQVLASGGLEVRYPKAHRIVPFNPA